MVNKLVVNKLYTDEEIKSLEGNWIDESYIKHPIIQSDTDVYYLNDNSCGRLGGRCRPSNS